MNGGATGLVSIVDRAPSPPAVKPQAGPVNVIRAPQDSCILVCGAVVGQIIVAVKDESLSPEGLDFFAGFFRNHLGV